ncbi:MAG: hypothetical protein ACLU4P_05830, partial [Ruminococcus sp.]
VTYCQHPFPPIDETSTFDVTDLKRRIRTKVLLPLLLEKPDILPDEPTNYLMKSTLHFAGMPFQEYENALS